MLFNRQSFNKGAFFNRSAPSASVSFAGTAAVVFSALAGTMRANARYGNATAGVIFGGAGALSTALPMAGEAGITFGAAAKLAADAFYRAQTGITLDASALAIRVANDKEISLVGLQFKPGDEIIIDTETLDVFYNGVPDVSSWVVGSDFFQLGKGTNTLTFYDDANTRQLSVTVIWADRWL